jgi:hypothetical protein
LAYYKTPFEDGGKLKILNACVEFPEDSRYSKNIHSLISTNAPLSVQKILCLNFIHLCFCASSTAESMLRVDPDERPDVFEILEKLAELRGKHYIRKIV